MEEKKKQMLNNIKIKRHLAFYYVDNLMGEMTWIDFIEIVRDLADVQFLSYVITRLKYSSIAFKLGMDEETHIDKRRADELNIYESIIDILEDIYQKRECFYFETKEAIDVYNNLIIELKKRL